MGYGDGYLAQTRSRGKFPDKLMRGLQREFAEDLQNATYVPRATFVKSNVDQVNTSTNEKTPEDVPGLMKELIASQKARIKLLEERQQSETRLIQVEATLKIIVGILNGLKIPEVAHTP